MVLVDYQEVVADIVCFEDADIITSSSDHTGMSKRDRKIAERERRWREEDLEEEYDEIDGIEDAYY